MYLHGKISVFEGLRIKACIVCVLLFGAIGEGNPASGNTGSEPLSDVRVFIDVSGSMKQNDPGYVRVSALKLLVNLLPPDSRAGVWLFAAESTPLVPIGDVNSAWKAKALESASEIHSRGLFTNIEDPLDLAARAWETEPSPSRKNIILLTDGVVDVSKGPEASKASRISILDRIAPRLQSLGAQVHTIALSDNADRELLEKLSFDTGGWNQSVQSAKQLERAFLSMFKKAAPRDRVPLTDNRFTIDAGIEEFSVLVFRDSGANPTRLINPEQARISQDDHGETVRWHHEASYDLITIDQPKPGEWRLLADLDPENQVMVVTDLRMKLNELPNYASENDTVEFAVSIREKGKTVINPDFLSLIDVRLEQLDDLGRKREWRLNADPADIGSFKQTVRETLSPGRHTFKIVANGRTFQREAEHRIDVVENTVNVQVSRTSDSAAASVRIQLIPDPDIIDLESVEVEASAIRASGEKETIDLAQDRGVWELITSSPPPGQRTILNFSVTAKTLRGNTVHPDVRPIVLDERLFNSLTREHPESIEVHADNDSLADEESHQAIREPDWMMTGVIAGVVNLVFVLGGFFLYRFMQKRSARQQMQLIDRLET